MLHFSDEKETARSPVQHAHAGAFLPTSLTL